MIEHAQLLIRKRSHLHARKQHVVEIKRKYRRNVLILTDESRRKRISLKKRNIPPKKKLSFCYNNIVIMFKFQGAQDGHSDNIAVFNLPTTDAGLESFEWIEYRPSGQLLPNSPIEFNIFGSSTSYIDLKSTLLYIKLKIVNGNNT